MLPTTVSLPVLGAFFSTRACSWEKQWGGGGSARVHIMLYFGLTVIYLFEERVYLSSTTPKVSERGGSTSNL
jgi:hypothetical protein